VNKALEFLQRKGASASRGRLPSTLAEAMERERREKAYRVIAHGEELDQTLDELSRTNKAQAFLQQVLAGRTAEVRPAYKEVGRIVQIPTHVRYCDEDRDLLQEALIQAHPYDDGFRFGEEQIEALLTFDEHKGLFGPIGVGKGKTFITIMCAALAYNEGVKKSVLFVPPNVYAQLMERDVPQARETLALFGLPFIWIGGEPIRRRRMLCSSGRKGCYVIPYSLLSSRDASEMLDAVKPGLIIADEAHMLKNVDSARTKRVKAYVEEHHPQFVALSGTMTLKSVLDYHHLMLWCLGAGSALPLTYNLAYEWAQVLDSETSATWQGESADTGPIMNLISWARQQDGCPHEVGASLRGFRAAYNFRMATTPGVVQSPNAEIGTSLTIEQYVPGPDCGRPGYEDLQELIRKVVTDWETPNGDPIDYGLHKFKWLHELTAGFWHKLTWPKPEKFAELRQISLAEAEEIVARAVEWHEAHKIYQGTLRKWLQKRHVKGLDTPFLVGGHISRFLRAEVSGKDFDLQVDPLLVALWEEQHKLDFDGRPEREATPIRVCDYKVQHAVAWAREHKSGIIWFWHNAIGQWLREALQEAGLEPLYCPAGDAGNKRILDSEGRLVVASIAAHNTGKNLQFHSNQLVVQWPRSAKDVEQMLGRLHRRGQQADELICHTNHASDFDYVLLAASLTDSLYIHQSGGGTQKAVVAGWNPLPKLFPHSVMEERGLDPQGGSAMEAAMRKHFGAGQRP